MLLHGFAGSPASWLEAAAHLDDGEGAVALSLPGHHPLVPVAAGFAPNIDRIASRLAELEIERCHLVGYSLGARVALALALDHPQRIARLTLIGVNPGLDDDARAERQTSDRRWIDLLRREGVGPFLTAWQQQPIFATQLELPGPVADRQRARRERHDAEQLARSLEHMGLGAMPDYRPRLGQLSVRTHIVVGARDAKFLAIGRSMIRMHPHLDLRRILDSGHNPLLEQPAALAALLRAS